MSTTETRKWRYVAESGNTLKEEDFPKSTVNLFRSKFLSSKSTYVFCWIMLGFMIASIVVLFIIFPRILQQFPYEELELGPEMFLVLILSFYFTSNMVIALPIIFCRIKDIVRSLKASGASVALCVIGIYVSFMWMGMFAMFFPYFLVVLYAKKRRLYSDERVADTAKKLNKGNTIRGKLLVVLGLVSLIFAILMIGAAMRGADNWAKQTTTGEGRWVRVDGYGNEIW